MRNAPPDKYNVAWFKLAECVSRGEKERALGVYRLLAHSLNDSAFSCQLQGDIYYSFNDVAGALEHYRKAAQLYQEDERLLESAAVYENVLGLASDKQPYISKLIELYSLLRIPSKLLHHAQTLSTLLLAQDDVASVLTLVDHLDQHLLPQSITPIRQQLVIAAAKRGELPSEPIERQAKMVIEHMIERHDAAEMQRFVAKVRALNPAYGTLVEACVQEADVLEDV